MSRPANALRTQMNRSCCRQLESSQGDLGGQHLVREDTEGPCVDILRVRLRGTDYVSGQESQLLGSVIDGRTAHTTSVVWTSIGELDAISMFCGPVNNAHLKGPQGALIAPVALNHGGRSAAHAVPRMLQKSVMQYPGLLPCPLAHGLRLPDQDRHE